MVELVRTGVRWMNGLIRSWAARMADRLRRSPGVIDIVHFLVGMARGLRLFRRFGQLLQPIEEHRPANRPGHADMAVRSADLGGRGELIVDGANFASWRRTSFHLGLGVGPL